jgi:DNA polymerase IIIc chi subunit
VIEVVSLDDVDRTQARTRFNAYRAAGLEPTTFKVQAE